MSIKDEFFDKLLFHGEVITSTREEVWHIVEQLFQEQLRKWMQIIKQSKPVFFVSKKTIKQNDEVINDIMRETKAQIIEDLKEVRG